ncbi:unnamed protein product, partial [Meganyctiphanes norvegica]
SGTWFIYLNFLNDKTIPQDLYNNIEKDMNELLEAYNNFSTWVNHVKSIECRDQVIEVKGKREEITDFSDVAIKNITGKKRAINQIRIINSLKTKVTIELGSNKPNKKCTLNTTWSKNSEEFGKYTRPLMLNWTNL